MNGKVEESTIRSSSQIFLDRKRRAILAKKLGDRGYVEMVRDLKGRYEEEPCLGVA